MVRAKKRLFVVKELTAAAKIITREQFLLILMNGIEPMRLYKPPWSFVKPDLSLRREGESNEQSQKEKKTPSCRQPSDVGTVQFGCRASR
jgi:hypothetical protein